MSLSRTIDDRRNAYHDALKRAQRGNDTTEWIEWFLDVVLEAQRDAEARIRFVLRKSKFFRRFEREFNGRQHKVISRIFEAGPNGFTGGMSARKYVALTGASKASAFFLLDQDGWDG